MKLFLIGGFLGSGKTTGILNAALSLKEQGMNTGIVTNDQGEELVDTEFLRMNGIAVEEVTGACFCCNFDELLSRMRSLRSRDSVSPDFIFAEAVGSCADLSATVANPLFHFDKLTDVTLSVFADVRLLSVYLENHKRVFHQAINYIYEKQLEEADMIVVNKVDLLSDEQLDRAKKLIEKNFSGKTILYQNSLTVRGVLPWLTMLLDCPLQTSFKQSIELDYDRYAEGEAQLAWLNERLEIHTADSSAATLGITLIDKVYAAIDQRKYPIGHLKFLLTDGRWYKKVSFVSGARSNGVEGVKIDSNRVTLLVNGRVQTTPFHLAEVMTEVTNELRDLAGCEIRTLATASFQPGYPRPTHRMST